MLILFFTFPLAVHTDYGLFLNMALLMAATFLFISLEHIVVALEVCFGLGAADVNALQMVAQLESELITILKLGEMEHTQKNGSLPRVLDQYTWVKLPPDYDVSPKRLSFSGPAEVLFGLALKTEAEIVERMYSNARGSVYPMVSTREDSGLPPMV